MGDVKSTLRHQQFVDQYFSDTFFNDHCDLNPGQILKHEKVRSPCSIIACFKYILYLVTFWWSAKEKQTSSTTTCSKLSLNWNTWIDINKIIHLYIISADEHIINLCNTLERLGSLWINSNKISIVDIIKSWLFASTCHSPLFRVKNLAGATITQAEEKLAIITLVMSVSTRCVETYFDIQLSSTFEVANVDVRLKDFNVLSLSIELWDLLAKLAWMSWKTLNCELRFF